jgi:hypothetical protein
MQTFRQTNNLQANVNKKANKQINRQISDASKLVYILTSRLRPVVVDC